MNKKRCIALILGTAMITSSFAGISTFSATELSPKNSKEIYSSKSSLGTFEYKMNNIILHYDFDTKVLSFTGKGAFPPFSEESYADCNRFGYATDEIVSNAEKIIIGDKITNVSSYLFSDMENVKEVSVGKDVTTINDYAFANCKSISSLSLPKVKTIKQYAFSNCKSLNSLKIEKNFSSIGQYAFSNCSLLCSVRGKGPVNIGNYAFDNCTSLSTFNLPNAKSLGSHCFNKTSILKTVTAPKASVGSYCFGEREQSVTKAEVGSLNNYALEKNTTIRTLILNKAKSIGNYALSGATGVREIKAPKVTSVGNYSFKDTKLTSVYLTNVRNIGSYAFANCKTIEKAYLGTNISKVGSGAFLDCQKINNGINLDKVTEIGPNAFANCKLIRCTSLGNKLRSIGSQAFAGCNKISRLYIPSTTKKIGSNLSSSVNSLSNSSVRINDNTERIKIYTPKGSTIYNKYYKNSHNKKLLRNAVKKITVNKTNITLKKGKSYKLVFTISNSNAAIKGINMTSSNTKVVKYLKSSHNKDNTVKYCYIKAMGKGSAYVTVKAKDGSNKTAKCKVTVK